MQLGPHNPWRKTKLMKSHRDSCPNQLSHTHSSVPSRMTTSSGSCWTRNMASFTWSVCCESRCLNSLLNPIHTRKRCDEPMVECDYQKNKGWGATFPLGMVLGEDTRVIGVGVAVHRGGLTSCGAILMSYPGRSCILNKVSNIIWLGIVVGNSSGLRQLASVSRVFGLEGTSDCETCSYPKSFSSHTRKRLACRYFPRFLHQVCAFERCHVCYITWLSFMYWVGGDELHLVCAAFYLQVSNLT